MTLPAPWRVRHLPLLLLLLAAPLLALANSDPLPSWKDGPSKQGILAFVQAVTTQGGPDYVKPAERIAVFDNDGTLWSEQPAYFEVLFAFDEIKRLAPQHPEWKARQPFQAVLEGDHQALAASGMHGLLQIIGATHTGISSEAFIDNARRWLAEARHPKTGRPFNQMIYQPMLEMLDYLRSQDFKTYIVSGGDTAFMRAFAESAYGIPPEQVIGSNFVTQWQFQDGQPSILRTAKLAHNDDGPGKPESIDGIIGRRPLLAFGNSDGDLQMLQWTAAGSGKRFMALVHHTDAAREWAYDRKSQVGRLDQALDQAQQHGWTLVDMAAEWRRIYPFEPLAPEQAQ